MSKKEKKGLNRSETLADIGRMLAEQPDNRITELHQALSAMAGKQGKQEHGTYTRSDYFWWCIYLWHHIKSVDPCYCAFVILNKAYNDCE